MNKNIWWTLPVIGALFYIALLFAYNVFPTKIFLNVRHISVFLYLLGIIPIAIIGFIALCMWVFAMDPKQANASLALRFFIFGPLLYAALIPISMAGFKYIPEPIPSYSYELEFDSFHWKSTDAWMSTGTQNLRGPSIRQKMLGDLIDNHLLAEDCDQIEAKLGFALDKNLSQTRMESSCLSGVKAELTYKLGAGQGFLEFMDIECIRIVIDENGDYLSYSLFSYD